MSYSITTQAVPQAPVQVPTPLPPPKNPSVNAREYSEGSMYDELNPEDLKASHGRYAAYKQWRHEIPTKRSTCSAIQTRVVRGRVLDSKWELEV
ncbi:hypothetical protein I312_103094 [Cryptococcus bacillisporus CA1280]|uniref:uncharacterized protein n=1 Tax=Cryptococcus bacillisporus CA1280 TaxID=1296109 RepID=UPI003365F1C6